MNGLTLGPDEARMCASALDLVLGQAELTRRTRHQVEYLVAQLRVNAQHELDELTARRKGQTP